VNDDALVIAIDGPSSSGKSSVAKGVARSLGLQYLDTGALYRAMTWLVLRAGLEIADEVEIGKLARNSKIAISTNPDQTWISADGIDITDTIRSAEVTDAVSQVSAVPLVREILVELQRKYAQLATEQVGGIVVEGRDIATVVLPKADIKVFLTASPVARATRRGLELEVDIAEVSKALEQRDLLDSTRAISPLRQDPDSTLIDTTNLDLRQSVDAVLSLLDELTVDIEADADIDSEWGDFLDIPVDLVSKPVVAILGRPNVGKSTLVNRILGHRSAVVEDQPGVTRDRVSYQAEWNGLDFTILDTGGWEQDAKGMYQQVAQQAEIAIKEADLGVLVVDSTIGATEDDQRIVQMLRAAKVPILLVANKVDTQVFESDAASLWSLGAGEPHLVSALHGRGAGDLLDVIVKSIPKELRTKPGLVGTRAVALLGRPNVGKSSLLNRLVGSNRAVVNEKAGTTVDPIDESVELDGSSWLFIDTAGIRKKFRQDSGHEYYAILRTKSAIERSEVVVVLIDVTEPLSDQDRRVINLAEETGRALILCFNKWDILDEDRRFDLEREIDKDLQQQRWIPRLNISATTGRGVEKIPSSLRKVLANWDRRIATSELNRFITDFVQANPHPLRGGRQAKILFATQVSSQPPTFALFVSRVLDEAYLRFLERRLRETFEFEGTPIRFRQKIKKRESTLK